MRCSLVIPFLIFGLTAAAGPFVNLTKRQTGHATYYQQGGAFGSCGEQHDDHELVVALPWAQEPKAHCGQCVTITNQGGGYSGRNVHVGKTIFARAVDTCGGCAPNDLDLSVGAWSELHGPDTADGRFDIEWHFF